MSRFYTEEVHPSFSYSLGLFQIYIFFIILYCAVLWVYGFLTFLFFSIDPSPLSMFSHALWIWSFSCSLNFSILLLSCRDNLSISNSKEFSILLSTNINNSTFTQEWRCILQIFDFWHSGPHYILHLWVYKCILV